MRLDSYYTFSCVQNLFVLGIIGTRPPLPDSPLGEEYTPVIKLFISCTEEDFNKRPSAKEIVECLKTLWVFMFLCPLCVLTSCVLFVWHDIVTRTQQWHVIMTLVPHPSYKFFYKQLCSELPYPILLPQPCSNEMFHFESAESCHICLYIQACIGK